MKSTYWIIGIVVIAVVGLIIYFGRGGYSTGKNTSPKSQSTTSTRSKNTVTMANFSFNPVTLTVPVGTTVTFVNDDLMTHTVTADDGSFKSDDLSGGSSYKHTFDKAGTFDYHCSIHSSMKGRVVVE